MPLTLEEFEVLKAKLQAGSGFVKAQVGERDTSFLTELMSHVVIEPIPVPIPGPIPIPVPAPLPIPAENLLYFSPPTGDVSRINPNDNETISLWPNVKSGQRLSGVFNFSVQPTNGYGAPKDVEGVEYRLLVDNEIQETAEIDLSNLPDGNHYVAYQVINNAGKYVVSAGRVFTTSVTGAPVQSKLGLVLSGRERYYRKDYSIAFARVDTGDIITYPHDPNFSVLKHTGQEALTLEDQQRLAHDEVWTTDGLSYPARGLHSVIQLLVKNAHGDYYIEHFNPQPFPSQSSSAGALRSVEASPQFDGARIKADLSSFSTLVADDQILDNGDTGWVFVDISGRVGTIDTSGRVTTFYGVRSKDDVIQTQHKDYKIGIAQRISKGEKEIVVGNDLVMPQDIAIGDEGLVYIADTGAGKVWSLNRNTGELISVYEIPGVSSVWYEAGMICAAAPDGVYVDGILTGDIPNAFWGRMKGDGNAYILTNTLAIYEFNPTSGTSTNIVPAVSGVQPFVFMHVDIAGLMGLPGTIYFSGSGNRTTIHYVTPSVDLEPRDYKPGLGIQNGQNFGDPFGHYMWGIAGHKTRSEFVTVGIANHWKIWTAHLRDEPTPVITMHSPNRGFHPSYKPGRTLWSYGVPGKHLPFSAVFETKFGICVDAWRNIKSVDDIEIAIKPLLPFDLTAKQIRDLAFYVYWLSTRPHFI